MNSIIAAIILGIVQGITEWLPVSSDGHLAIAHHLLGVEQPLVFDVVLHFGSLLVIFFVFRKDLFDFIMGIMKRDAHYWKLFFQLSLATIPVAFAGFFFNEIIKFMFKDLFVVGISLLVTSVFLFFSRFPKEKKNTLNYKNTFIIGLAQASALLPGVSRSATTISTAMMQGIKSEDAAKFSFFLAIPAILGANILEIRHLSEVTDLTALLVATITTIIVGFISLKALLFVIRKNKFSYFSIYCFVAGLVVLLLL